MSAPPARRAIGGHPARAARVARALSTLESDGWTCLSRVHRPGGGRRLVDHVLVGPGGVVVVDSHAWVGRIEVTRGAVQQNGFWREAETAEVAATAGSVAALLPPRYRTAVHALVCVAQHDLSPQVVAPGVHVVGVTELGRVLRGLPPRLHPTEILEVHALLRGLLADAAPPEQLTTAELDRLPPRDPVGWEASTLPLRALPLDGGLFAPVGRGVPGGPTGPAGAAGAPALRAAVTRVPARRRAARPWRVPDWRGFTARLVIAVLVAVGVILLAPTVLHHRDGDARQVRPVPTAPGSPTAPGGSAALDGSGGHAPPPAPSLSVAPAPYLSGPAGKSPFVYVPTGG